MDGLLKYFFSFKIMEEVNQKSDESFFFLIIILIINITV